MIIRKEKKKSLIFCQINAVFMYDFVHGPDMHITTNSSSHDKILS